MATSKSIVDHTVWPVVWFGPSAVVDVVTNGSIMDHMDHLVWSVVLLLWSPENSQLLVWRQQSGPLVGVAVTVATVANQQCVVEPISLGCCQTELWLWSVH